MATPDQVTKTDLDSYITTLFFGILSSYDGLREQEKAAVTAEFGGAWDYFVYDGEKLRDDELVQFLLKTYAGPLWQSRQGSFAISGSYKNFYKITTIAETPDAMVDASKHRMMAYNGGDILYGYGDDRDFSYGGNGLGTGEFRGINSSFTVNFKDFFYHISPKGIKGEEARKIIYRLTEAGLLDLLFLKPKIQNFAKKRFVSKEKLQSSALEAADAYGEDLDWISALQRTYNSLVKDPVSAWLMAKYFPNLAQFIFASLASAADYSNNGFGGSTKDPLNDPIEMAKRMFKAFGTDEKGDAIFKPAWTLINTAARIESALAEFPFRNSIPPRPPDIFHLRLGAANFYVPPVTININSIFKTGSLTGRRN